MKRRLRSSDDDDDDFPDEEEEMRRRRRRPILHRTSSSTSTSYNHYKSSVPNGGKMTGRGEDDVSSWGGISSRTQLLRKSSNYNSFELRRQEQQQQKHGFGWHRSSSSSSFVGDKASHYRGGSMSYDVDRHRIHRSESFSGSSRRDYFPKGPRSERDRSLRHEEGSCGMPSWRRRFGDSPDNEASGGGRSGSDMDRASRERDDRVSSLKSPKGHSRDLNPMKSPTWSGSNQSKVRSPAAVTGYSGRHGNIVKSPSSWSKEESASEPFLKGKSSSKGKKDDDKRKSSPTWSSKDSESEQSNARRSPPPKTRAAKSPSSWSFKDSGSEQSKSVQDDKNPSLQVHVGGIGSSSDMEEGELKSEPDPDAGDDEPNPSSTDELTEEVQSQSAVKQPDTSEFEDRQQGDDTASIIKENCQAEMSKVAEESAENTSMGKVYEKESTNNKTSGNLDEILEACKDDDDDSNHLTKEQHEHEYGDKEKESSRDSCVAKPPLPVIDECNTGKNVDLELKAVDAAGFKELAKDSLVLHEAFEAGTSLPMELAQNDGDKGKSIAVTTTSGEADSVKAGSATDIEARNFLGFGENNVEVPSSRGFELFSNSTFKKLEKRASYKLKEEKVALEALDLSLSLPNVLLPLRHNDAVPVQGSPNRATSVQTLTDTFCTDSEGFTASMSFTGSQSLMHNPSCSMTHNSIDYEQSVGSHPIFKGIDQASHETCPGQSNDEHKTKENPLYQQILINGGGTSQQFASTANVSNSHSSKKHHQWVLEGKPNATMGTDQRISQWQSPHEDIRTALQSTGCGKTTSGYSRENAQIRERTGAGGSLNMSSSFRERERLVIGASDPFETLTRLLSQPAEKMNRTFHELAELSIKMVKECVYELFLKFEYQGKLIGVQKMVQNRSDLTIEILLKLHRDLLEILVSLKTGMKEFLQPNISYLASDLPEIFLNLRCKNPSCRSRLPVDECDCKICSQKNGFCSACMCLICSKFDMASNTCSWVGCDVCLHWCHTGCALGKSYIRNGLIIKGDDRTPEMQFQCVACSHPSEMFGFVKEVFQNFAKDWSTETLSKELECVKRIFHASEDSRGRQIWDVANKLLTRLANKANFSEVYNLLMRFLTGTESADLGNSSNFVRKDTSKNHLPKGSNAIGSSQEPLWQTSVHPQRVLKVDRVNSVLPYSESNQNKRSILDLDPIRRSTKEPVFDELETIVKAKQAEAEVFQTRSIDARREAECLKCIAVAKKEKTEQEYDSRITKLRLFEAEELRRQKLEELQMLERAHREYFKMKVRMEADIKDLLLKMETTNRNLAN